MPVRFESRTQLLKIAQPLFRSHEIMWTVRALIRCRVDDWHALHSNRSKQDRNKTSFEASKTRLADALLALISGYESVSN